MPQKISPFCSKMDDRDQTVVFDCLVETSNLNGHSMEEFINLLGFYYCSSSFLPIMARMFWSNVNMFDPYLPPNSYLINLKGTFFFYSISREYTNIIMFINLWLISMDTVFCKEDDLVLRLCQSACYKPIFFFFFHFFIFLK